MKVNENQSLYLSNVIQIQDNELHQPGATEGELPTWYVTGQVYRDQYKRQFGNLYPISPMLVGVEQQHDKERYIFQAAMNSPLIGHGNDNVQLLSEFKLENCLSITNIPIEFIDTAQDAIKAFLIEHKLIADSVTYYLQSEFDDLNSINIYQPVKECEDSV